jgi:hypothetical protein
VIAVQVPRAYLRVLEPLTAFPPRDRARWAAYVEAGNALPWHVLAQWEERVTFARTVGLGEGRAGRHDGHAYVEQRDRTVYICPVDLDLRMLHALASLRQALPEEVIESFLSPRELDRAARLVSRLPANGGSPRCRIRQSSWAVPLPWFVLFDDLERRLVTDGRHRGQGRPPRLFYVTTMAKARARLDRALGALECLTEVVEFATLTEELRDWLSVFDTRSVINLDYGGLAGVIPMGDLAADHTAREIWEALAALEAGDLVRSDELYTSISERWAEMRGREGRN